MISKNIKKILPPLEKVVEIKKGFSEESKYWVTTVDGEFLIRICYIENYGKKLSEFGVIEKCYTTGN